MQTGDSLCLPLGSQAPGFQFGVGPALAQGGTGSYYMSTVKRVIPECRRSQSPGCHEDRNLIRVGMQPGPDGLIQRLRQQPHSILQCPYPPTHPAGPSGRQGQSSFSQVDRAHLDESLPGPRAISRMLLLAVGLVPTPHSPSPEACSPSSQIFKFLNRTIYCM